MAFDIEAPARFSNLTAAALPGSTQGGYTPAVPSLQVGVAVALLGVHGLGTFGALPRVNQHRVLLPLWAVRIARLACYERRFAGMSLKRREDILAPGVRDIHRVMSVGAALCTRRGRTIPGDGLIAPLREYAKESDKK